MEENKKKELKKKREKKEEFLTVFNIDFFFSLIKIEGTINNSN